MKFGDEMLNPLNGESILKDKMNTLILLPLLLLERFYLTVEVNSVVNFKKWCLNYRPVCTILARDPVRLRQVSAPGVCARCLCQMSAPGVCARCLRQVSPNFKK